MALRRRAAKGAVEEPTGPARVLIVNDEEGGLELLSRIVERAGYDVGRAGSAEQAMAEVHRGHPDCTVLDLTASGIGGNLTLLDHIRSSRDTVVSHTRVVLVAQQSTNRMFSWQAGIDAFLVRPFHADELLRDIADSLARPDEDRSKHRRRELEAAKSQGRG